MDDTEEQLTPMMRQFREAKRNHPGMLVLFRNGDFYELFEDDAEVGHKLLGLTLTKRDKEIPMAGFPQHKLEHYLGVLLKMGRRVAVCEQMEEPGAGKKIIRREVNRVVTPGTVTEDELLDPRAPNHLAAVVRGKGSIVGLAWLDLSTGDFHAADVGKARLENEAIGISVSECLVVDAEEATWRTGFLAGYSGPIVGRPKWTFESAAALEILQETLGVASCAGFGFDDGQPCLLAAGAILLYLKETLRSSLGHIRGIAPHRPEKTLILDEVTRRSLELTRTLRESSREGSLLSLMDRTVTPPGARFLHDALLAPPCERAEVEARQGAVDELLRDHEFRASLRSLLEETSDLHRLTTRAATARSNPKDLAAIARTLRQLPKIKAKLSGRKSILLGELETRLELQPELRELLDRALADDPPYSAKEGGIIREGHHPELDELRRLARDGKDWIAKYQAEESLRTGITSLKVGFTDVMGYYIEITNANETRVPPEYHHERTLKNCKRYSTPRLKEYEEKVVTAQERSQALEFELFVGLRDHVAARTTQLLGAADILAKVDFLAGLAELASSRNYVRPVMTDDPVLDIREGRHPVLEQLLPPGTFTPNDVAFGPEEGLFRLITGPNMSGKSTYIRQTALMVLMAHVGSFVPAKSALVGMVDRIFTRVGASDEIGRGFSTFMVEMTEAANILNNAGGRSLVILDEIGRGTSTYDGVSLAWSIAEYLHDVTCARTLFATHYHELTRLAQVLPRLRNFTVQVTESEDEVIFLHRIAPGAADRSYGIHVARLAGVPNAVLRRAEEVLATLEATNASPPADIPRQPRVRSARIDPDRLPRKTKPTGPGLFETNP